MDGCMANSCKQRADYFYHSLVIVHTEHGQWQASFIWEKSACLVEVSETVQIFPNSQKSCMWSACINSVYQTLFSLPLHKGLGMRLVKQLTAYCNAVAIC